MSFYKFFGGIVGTSVLAGNFYNSGDKFKNVIDEYTGPNKPSNIFKFFGQTGFICGFIGVKSAVMGTIWPIFIGDCYWKYKYGLKRQRPNEESWHVKRVYGFEAIEAHFHPMCSEGRDEPYNKDRYRY